MILNESVNEIKRKKNNNNANIYIYIFHHYIIHSRTYNLKKHIIKYMKFTQILFK